MVKFFHSLTLAATYMDIVKNILNLFKKETSNEKTTMYYSYYLFGHYNDKPIWNWENWQKCISMLQPIVELCTETPLIKTNQSIPVKYGKDNQFSSYDKGSLRFGKMIWNEENNKKWTTKYSNEENWEFFDTEISYPSRSNCHKNNTNPELLITIHNEDLNHSKENIINQSITIHIQTKIITIEKLKAIEEYIYKIGYSLNCSIAGKIKRQTSYKTDIGIGYTDSFWDGSYGVLNVNKIEFSDNYKRYGIELMKIGSS